MNINQLRSDLIKLTIESQELGNSEIFNEKSPSRHTNTQFFKPKLARMITKFDSVPRSHSRGREIKLIMNSLQNKSHYLTPEMTKLSLSKPNTPGRSQNKFDKRSQFQLSIKRPGNISKIDTVIGTAYQPYTKPSVKPKTIIIYTEKPRLEISQDRLYLNFIKKLQVSNGIKLGQSEAKYFKFYVGPGNNPSLIRQVLKRRPWWIASGSMNHSNFIWTSNKLTKVFSKLFSVQSSGKFPRRCNFRGNKDQGHDLILGSPHFKVNETPYVTFSESLRIYNKIVHNKHICSKKGLFYSLKSYLKENVFKVIPLSFHVQSKQDPNYIAFLDRFQNTELIWIVKPGEKTNRGKGILVTSSLQSIDSFIANEEHTYIIQKYITNPLLINNRKFDIRCYLLVTIINGYIQAYFYEDGYIRTSSYEFTLEPPFCNYIHLTNDAIQKNSEFYGKFEQGNKLSYQEFQEYCRKSSIQLDVYSEILPRMKEIMTDCVRASYTKLDPNRLSNTFELIGFDFMVDTEFKVWLIEANTNPCLEKSSDYLSKLLPELIDNTFLIVLDPLFPPPNKNGSITDWIATEAPKNKYELIFSG